MPRRTYASDERQFQAANVAIAKLPPPPDLRPKDIGISAATAAGYKKLSAPQFSLDYPATWKVYGDSESNILAIAPDDGLTFVNGDPAIGLGLVVSYFFPDPDRSSLSTATTDLIQRLRSVAPGTRESGGQKQIEINKQPALLTQFAGDSPFGGTETDLLVTVARPEGLFYLIFISADKDANQTRPMFDHMVQSFRFQESQP